MDGRIQEPLCSWIKKNHGVDYVDVITEPGVDKAMSRDAVSASIRTKANISVKAHGSKIIIISGHHDCAANPASEEDHIKMIRDAVRVASSWNLGAEVAGAWVDESWSVTGVGSL